MTPPTYHITLARQQPVPPPTVAQTCPERVIERLAGADAHLDLLRDALERNVEEGARQGAEAACRESRGAQGI